ncbi:TPA: hypothetical protein DCX16_06435 [bacterium]|nr:hypothetical protein [bacterium]
MNKTNLNIEISKVALLEEDELDVLFRITELIANSVNADSGFIFLSKGKDKYKREAFWGTIDIPKEIERGKGCLGLSIAEEKPLILSSEELFEISNAKSCLIAPLRDKMGFRGIIGFVRGEISFSENELNNLVAISSEINLCLEIFRINRAIYEGVLFSTVQTLISVIEATDPYLRGHSWNVARYSVALASKMDFPRIQIEAIKYASLLHEVGRICIPHRIWRKESELSEEELNAVKTHAIIGEKIVEKAEFPFDVASIVRSHHENYNGAGYPDGLKGDKIPIGARVLSVTNAWDAMVSDRPYRSSMTVGEAILELKNGRGGQFDPKIVDVFLSIIEK